MLFANGISYILVGAACGLLLAVFGGFCGWVLFPALITLNIDKQTVFINGTEQYERWVHLPQPLHFKVYLFNVTNADEILEGAMPIVNEVGPYVYREYRDKIVTNISPDQTIVTFKTIQKFVFDSEASAPCTENDNLVLLNAHLNAIFQIAENVFTVAVDRIGHEVNKSIEQTLIISTIRHLLVSMSAQVTKLLPKDHSVLQSTESSMPPQLALIAANVKEVFGEKYSSMFINVKPAEILFAGIPLCVNPLGISRLICSIIKSRKLQTIRELSDGSLRFSLFGHKNNSHDGLFSMYTGVGDISKLGKIVSWNRHDTIKTWKSTDTGRTSVCNMINGTDTTIFAPHRKPGGYEDIFSTDICRSARIYYKGNVNYNGIPALRFQTDDSFLNEIGPEYGTECFCTATIENIPSRPNGCLYKGALDLTSCQGKKKHTIENDFRISYIDTRAELVQQQTCDNLGQKYTKLTKATARLEPIGIKMISIQTNLAKMKKNSHPCLT